MNTPLQSFVSITLMFVFSCAVSRSVSAQNLNTEEEPFVIQETAAAGPIKLLEGNEPSYFVFARDSGDSSFHVEFYLSIKYPLLTRLVRDFLGENSKVLFNYSGKYDFYTTTRHSSPVISRKQNPGLQYEYEFPEPYLGLRSIKTGYFHESNGQTIDTKAQYDISENAGDYVSRGWDYIQLELKFDLSAFDIAQFDQLYLYCQGRYFLPKQMFRQDKEDEIFWDPIPFEQPGIEDYDGLRIILSKIFMKHEDRPLSEIKLSAIFRTGYHSFNISQRYEGTLRLYDLPLYIYYFEGYGTEIATYHQKGSSFGIGLEFW